MPMNFNDGNGPDSGGVQVGFSLMSKIGVAWVKFERQTDWNDQEQKPVFIDGESLKIVLETKDLGGIIRAIATNGRHSGEKIFVKTVTKFVFGFKAAEGQKPDHYVFKAKKNGDEPFVIELSLAQAETLSEYCKFALEKIFSSIYSEDKRVSESKEKEEPKAVKEDKPVVTKATPKVESPKKKETKPVEKVIEPEPETIPVDPEGESWMEDDKGEF